MHQSPKGFLAYDFRKILSKFSDYSKHKISNLAKAGGGRYDFGIIGSRPRGSTRLRIKSKPDGLEGMKMVLWEKTRRRNPDWRPPEQMGMSVIWDWDLESRSYGS